MKKIHPLIRAIQTYNIPNIKKYKDVYCKDEPLMVIYESGSIEMLKIMFKSKYIKEYISQSVDEDFSSSILHWTMHGHIISDKLNIIWPLFKKYLSISQFKDAICQLLTSFETDLYFYKDQTIYIKKNIISFLYKLVDHFLLIGNIHDKKYIKDYIFLSYKKQYKYQNVKSYIIYCTFNEYILTRL